MEVMKKVTMRKAVMSQVRLMLVERSIRKRKRNIRNIRRKRKSISEVRRRRIFLLKE